MRVLIFNEVERVAKIMEIAQLCIEFRSCVIFIKSILKRIYEMCRKI